MVMPLARTKYPFSQPTFLFFAHSNSTCRVRIQPGQHSPMPWLVYYTPFMLTSSLPIRTIPPPLNLPLPLQLLLFNIHMIFPLLFPLLNLFLSLPLLVLLLFLIPHSLITLIPWLQYQNMVYISLKLCRFIMPILWQNLHRFLLLLSTLSGWLQ